MFDKTTELQTFSYHSGAQISVWFGDIWVNDISSISWQYSQEKRPLYGYASTYFDAVSRGQVIVQGNFTINFRHRDYISFVVDNIRRLEYSTKTSFSNSEGNERWSRIRTTIAKHLRAGTFGPQTYHEIEELGKSSTFWDDVDTYERIIWDSLDEQEKAAVGTPDVIQHVALPKGFNIQIIYGEDLVDQARATPYDVMSTTEKTLRGVHLLGSSQLIQTNGEPIQEGYSFFAKSIDESIIS